MQSYLLATGPAVADPTGEVPLRLEIRDLAANFPDMFNLYILGLDRMQKLPQSARESYYQLSGIHGRPSIAWDRVAGRTGQDLAGYCTHSSILFPTWHRPYIALFEQILWDQVQAVAASFPEGPARERYQAIAPDFRAPYWDWAADATLPDFVATLQTIEVEVPDESSPDGVSRESIPNPLYSYKFNPVNPRELPDPPFNRWRETVRYPTRNGTSQPERMNAQLRNNRLTIRDRTFDILMSSDYNDYRVFSNTAWGRNRGYDSIESVHDQLHGLVGNGGNMSSVDYSAFDPVFWLHHTNVDRIFAIWQAIWPNSYVVNQRSVNSTFSTPVNTIEGPTSPLSPFHQTQTRFWDSNGVRSLKTFGSTYPELIDWGANKPGTPQYRAQVVAAVRRLYGQTNPATVIRDRQRAMMMAQGGSQPAARAAATSIPIPQTDGPAEGVPGLQVQDARSKPPAADPTCAEPKVVKWDEYNALIRVKKYALGKTFFVHVFLGDFTPDAPDWTLDPNLVGTHVVFVNKPETTACGKCKEDVEAELQVTGQIPLTGAVLDKIEELGEMGLERENVKQFLKRHLHWRITMDDDERVHRDDPRLESLRIAVTVKEVEDDDDPSTPPIYGPTEVLTEITQGRPCGLNPDDEI